MFGGRKHLQALLSPHPCLVGEEKGWGQSLRLATEAQLARSAVGWGAAPAKDLVLCGTAIVRGQKGSEGKHTRADIIYLGAAPLCPQGQHLRLQVARCTQLSISTGVEKTKCSGFCWGFFYLWG